MNYLFFFFDAVNKIILSNYVSPNRDTESAIYALREVKTEFEIEPMLLFQKDLMQTLNLKIH